MIDIGQFWILRLLKHFVDDQGMIYSRFRLSFITQYLLIDLLIRSELNNLKSLIKSEKAEGAFEGIRPGRHQVLNLFKQQE
jgi:hypothetical protein